MRVPGPVRIHGLDTEPGHVLCPESTPPQQAPVRSHPDQDPRPGQPIGQRLQRVPGSAAPVSRTPSLALQVNQSARASTGAST